MKVEDPLDYWKIKRNEYHLLSDIALEFESHLHLAKSINSSTREFVSKTCLASTLMGSWVSESMLNRISKDANDNAPLDLRDARNFLANLLRFLRKLRITTRYAPDPYLTQTPNQPDPNASTAPPSTRHLKRPQGQLWSHDKNDDYAATIFGSQKSENFSRATYRDKEDSYAKESATRVHALINYEIKWN
uniref:Uncharacterized protein n=1 Tax=Romanomermis culicivorax TaxID=13658 RepID=A0A915JDZ5_ROMCU